MADATVSIGADLSQLRRDLAKIPNLSAGAAQKTLISLERTVLRAEKAAKRAAKSTARAQRQAAKAADKALQQTKEGFKGLIELAGFSGDSIEKMGAVVGALATPAGVATVAVTGLSLAVAGLAAGMVGIVAAADDFARDLRKLDVRAGLGIDAATLAGLEQANAALSGIGVVAKRAVVILGNEFAPVVERVAVGLIAFGLRVTDAMARVQEGGGIVRELAVVYLQQLIKNLAGAVGVLLRAAKVAGSLAAAVGADGLAGRLKAASGAWDDLTRSLAEGAVDKVFGATADAVDRLGGATDEYDVRARHLVESLEQQLRLQNANTAAIERHRRQIEQTTKAYAAQIDVLAEGSRALDFARDLAAVDVVDDGTLARLSELNDQVDALAPAEALSRVDQLRLLLLDLQLQQASTAEGAAGLAEAIERVEGALQVAIIEGEVAKASAALDELADGVDAVESRGRRLREVLAGIGSTASSIVGAAAGLADTLTGGALSDVGAAATSGDGAPQAVRAAVDSGVAFAESLADQLPAVLDELIAAVPRLVDALVASIPAVLQAIADKGPKLVASIVRAVPRVIGAVLDSLPGVIDSVVEQIPTVIDAVIAAVPRIIVRVAQALPDLVESLVVLAPTIAVALVSAIFTELIPQLPRIAVELGKGLAEAIRRGLRSLVRFFRDLVVEIGSVGKKKTRTFGDTPGPVRVGVEGLTARFAPGDVVVAGRTEQAAAAQLGAGASARQPAPPQRVVVDLASGHLAFERSLRSSARGGGTLAQMTRDSRTGRTEVYRG